LVWFGLVWFGLVWFGLVWFGLVWFGLVWFGLGWFGLVWFGLVWFGLVCFVFCALHTLLPLTPSIPSGVVSLLSRPLHAGQPAAFATNAFNSSLLIATRHASRALPHSEVYLVGDYGKQWTYIGTEHRGWRMGLLL
jgi:hypothetical protein